MGWELGTGAGSGDEGEENGFFVGGRDWNIGGRRDMVEVNVLNDLGEED